ncbi:ribosomal RNA processing protein 1 homolog A [Hippocampus comes]|uniref:ribosomal RNA processing protein 1 homolog A n=1 Tax=Hippocampus comes TaxID=109280 RepID=UPI00094E61DA|nr:PREDICTED: ribosomal RNA processing protein 1 homolog A-like [Hippocampus comes]
MAAVQDPEIQLAQKLASNEKPIRTKALKKLKKYINVRSQKPTDGFTSEEMLKLWKGLFYCLWMQDKPLLQEELSNSLCTLIHTFHDIDGQLLYLESSLKTFKREWTGIDRLLMDKFFQLIRFMFRQSFEMLKRNNWDSSVVSRFLELFATELLNSGNGAPAGLQFHILDLYLTELAAVGASELTADQNLRFIEPFCKTAAKTKDRTLFGAICNSIFNTIIDQAPYAIEDLMKELKAAESSDSGQSSEGDDEEDLVKQINGSQSYLKQDAHESGDSDTELPFDDDDNIAPVLQFDYAALADKLLEVSIRSSTPSHNRERLYKIIKVLQDLSEGLFPQDGYPEEVSTDEDDEMFASRKRMKRGKTAKETAKNRKKKMQLKQDDDSDNDDMKPTDLTNKDIAKPWKKKKVSHDGCLGANLNARISNGEVTEAPNQSKIVLSESEDMAKKESSVSASDKASNLNSCTTNKKSKKKKKRPTSQCKEKLENNETTQEAGTTAVIGEHESPLKNSVKLESQAGSIALPPPCEITSNETELQASNTAKTKKKGLKAQKVKAFAVCSPKIPLDSLSIPCDNSAHVGTPLQPQGLTDATAVDECKRKNNKTQNVLFANPSTNVENEFASDNQMGTPLKKKNKRKYAKVKEVSSSEKEPEVGDEASDSLGKPNKKKRKIPVVFEFEADEFEPATPPNDTADIALDVKKSKAFHGSATPKAKPKTLSSDLVTFQRNVKVPTPLFFRTKGKCTTQVFGKKMGQTPTSDSKKVTFHLKNNKTAEFKKNDRSLLLSPEGSSKVPFDPQQKPKSGVLKSSPMALSTNIKTPNASSKRAFSTPKSTPKRRPVASDFF